MDYTKFDIKLSFLLTAAFILMTIVGTLSHELVHYSVSKCLGYEASINYGSSSHWEKEPNRFLEETYKRYSSEIRNDKDFPNKGKFLKLVDQYQSDGFLITLGGPLQTMLTGTISLLLLMRYRRRLILPDKVHFMGWLLIFFSLFWLRQVANLFMGIVILIAKGAPSFRGDEPRLAHYLNMNIWIFQIITGVIGLGVLLLVLKYLPKKLVLTFVISGLFGGVLGYYLWLVKFGPIIMP